MKTKDIRTKSPADLAKFIAENEAELRTFRFGMTGGHSKNIRKSRALKKTIARVKTILNEKK